MVGTTKRNSWATWQMPRPAPALHIFTAACGPSEYMRQVLVLVRSVHDTTARRGQPVELHLIHDGGAAARGLLGRLARISADRLLPNLVVSGHQLNGTESTRAESIAHGFGPCSASRLWIPNSRDFMHLNGAAIWLDVDVLVRRDLRELASLADAFNSTQWAGLARECPVRCWYTRNAEGERKRIFDTGLNSGVMLFRLDRWRSSGLLAHLRDWPANSCYPHTRSAHWPANTYTGPNGECAQRTRKLNYYMSDQDVLNSYFHDARGEVYVLPCEWNVRTDSDCLPPPIDTGVEPVAIWHGSRGAMSKMHDGKSLSKEERREVVFAFQEVAALHGVALDISKAYGRIGEGKSA